MPMALNDRIQRVTNVVGKPIASAITAARTIEAGLSPHGPSTNSSTPAIVGRRVWQTSVHGCNGWPSRYLQGCVAFALPQACQQLPDGFANQSTSPVSQEGMTSSIPPDCHAKSSACQGRSTLLRDRSNFTLQHLSKLIWETAREGRKPSDRWLYNYYTACSHTLQHSLNSHERVQGGQQLPQQGSVDHELSSQELNMLLWSFGRLKLQPPPSLRAVLLAVMEQQLHVACHRVLANMIWALARMRIKPSDSFMRTWYRCFLNSTQHVSCQEHNTSQQLHHHPNSDDHAKAATAWPVQVLDMLPEHQGQELDKQHWQQDGQNLLQQPTAPHQVQLGVAQALWSLASLQLRPQQTWIASVLQATGHSLHHASPQSLCNTVWALGELKHTPTSTWNRGFMQAAQKQLRNMTAQGVCNLIHGMHTASIPVRQSFADDIMTVIADGIRSKAYNAAQLSLLVWDLSQLKITMLPNLVTAAMSAACAHLAWYAGSAVPPAKPSDSVATSPVSLSVDDSNTLSSHSLYRQRHSSNIRASVESRGALIVAASKTGSKRVIAGSVRSIPGRYHPHSASSRSVSLAGSGCAQSNVLLMPAGRSLSPSRVMAQQLTTTARSVSTSAISPRKEGGSAAVSLVRPQVRWSTGETSALHTGAPTIMHMRLKRLYGIRAQKARVQRRAQQLQKLSQLSPEVLARLLQGLAQGMQDTGIPQPRPYWRATCAQALRISLPHMNCRMLAQTLGAAHVLGVRPPLLPTQHSVYRAVCKADRRAANDVVDMLAAILKSRQLARPRLVLVCIRKLVSVSPYLSCEGVVQLAKTLPVLHEYLVKKASAEIHTTGRVSQALASKDSNDLSHTQVQQQQPSPLHEQLHSAMTALTHNTVLRTAQHLPKMLHPDLQPCLAALANLPEYSAASALASHPPAETKRQQQTQKDRNQAEPQQFQPAVGLHPFSHLLQAIEPQLSSYPALQLAHLLPSIAANSPVRPSPSFLETAETASLSALKQLCLSGKDKVQLLHALRHMGHTPRREWATAWYESTLVNIPKLDLHQLHTALMLAEGFGQCPGHDSNPPQKWLQAVCLRIPQHARFELGELQKTLQQLTQQSPTEQLDGSASHPIVPESMVESVGFTIGNLFAAACRLDRLRLPIQQNEQAAILMYQSLVLTSMQKGSLPVGVMFHTLHAMRGIQPMTAPTWIKSAMSELLSVLMASNTADVFLQAWEQAASATDLPSAPVSSSPATKSGSSTYTPPPRAAVAAAQKVLCMLNTVAYWGIQAPTNWLQDVLRQVTARIGCFTGPQAAALLRSLALLGLNGSTPAISGTLQHLLDSCRAALQHNCPAPQLAEIAWSLSVMQAEPRPSWWRWYENEVLSRACEMRSEDLCEVMWSFGSLRHRPTKAWMEGFAKALLPHMHTCSFEQLARLIWSLAAMEEAPTDLMMERFSTATGRLLQQPGTYSAQSLALMIGGLASLGVYPNNQWLQHFERVFCSTLPQCRGVHLSKILHSLAVMKHQMGQSAVHAAVQVAKARVAEFEPAAAAQLIWAVEHLDCSPGKHHLSELLEVFDEQCSPHAAALSARYKRHVALTEQRSALPSRPRGKQIGTGRNSIATFQKRHSSADEGSTTNSDSDDRVGGVAIIRERTRLSPKQRSGRLGKSSLRIMPKSR